MAARRLGDRLNRIGATMVACCVAILIVGRLLVLLLGPGWAGQGLTPLALIILIPIWAIGVAGLVLLLGGLSFDGAASACEGGNRSAFDGVG